MDETAKIIIGTISGFLIAFLAEPVKNYFQNPTKRRHIKNIIYKELFHNVAIFANTIKITTDNDSNKWSKLKTLMRPFIHFEAYDYAINNEIAVFFQLKESIGLRGLYKALHEIFHDNNLSDVEAIGLINVFTSGFLSEVEEGRLDKKIFVALGKEAGVDFNKIITDYKLKNKSLQLKSNPIKGNTD